MHRIDLEGSGLCYCYVSPGDSASPESALSACNTSCFVLLHFEDINSLFFI